MNKFSALIASLLAIVGFLFSLNFQGMFYWGGKSFGWFYTGAILSYLFSIASVLMMISTYRRQGLKESDIIFNLISSLLVGATFLWTTFIVIAWQSGF